MDSPLDLAVDAIMEHCTRYYFNSAKQRWEGSASTAKNIGYGTTQEEASKMLHMIVDNVVNKRSELANIDGHEAAKAETPPAHSVIQYTTNIFSPQGLIANGDVGEMSGIAVSVGQQPVKHISVESKDWHIDRLKKIRSGNWQDNCKSGPLLVIHLGPLEPAGNFSGRALQEHAKFAPRYQEGATFTSRLNQDGLINIDNASDYQDKMCRGHVQTFRNGKIESIRILRLFDYNGTSMVSGADIDREIVFSVTDFMIGLRALEAIPPFALSVSLMQVQGLPLLYGPHHFDRIDVTLPLKIISEFPVVITRATVAELLRDELDILWQCSGQAASGSFNPDGSPGANFTR